MGESERFLTVSEAAGLLGVSAASLRRWSDRGVVPVYRTPGGQRRYERAALEDFVVSMRRDQATPTASGRSGEPERDPSSH